MARACSASSTLIEEAGTLSRTTGTRRPASILRYRAAWSAILDEAGRRVGVVGRGYLAGNAHIVAVDPTTHRSFYPIPKGSDGAPALLFFDADH